MTKAEILEMLELFLVEEEAQNMRRMDVLSSIIDYVESSKDERAEMDQYFKDNNNKLLKEREAKDEM